MHGSHWTEAAKDVPQACWASPYTTSHEPRRFVNGMNIPARAPTTALAPRNSSRAAKLGMRWVAECAATNVARARPATATLRQLMA